MAYDLKLTHSSLRLGRLLAAGTIVEAEGKLMVAVVEDGVEKAAIAASAAGTDKDMGLSSTGDSLPDQTSDVEVVTVPSALICGINGPKSYDSPPIATSLSKSPQVTATIGIK